MGVTTIPSGLHRPFDPSAFRWEGVGETPYKDREGRRRGMSWQGLNRFTLATPETLAGGFEQRYFEIAPGGFSSLEKHAHVHLVVVLRGHGRALIGDRIVDLAPLDVVQTPPWTPHRWVHAGASDEPFGFLCTVDGDRDRPSEVDEAEWDALRADPRTAGLVF